MNHSLGRGKKKNIFLLSRLQKRKVEDEPKARAFTYVTHAHMCALREVKASVRRGEEEEKSYLWKGNKNANKRLRGKKFFKGAKLLP